MKRPLIKLYIVLAAALAAAVLLVPDIVGKTSSFAVSAATKASLAGYNAKHEADSSADGKAHAVIIMDDGWETQFSAGYEIMSRYGMKGCIAVVPGHVGSEGYMDYEQLAKMYMNGWDMLNHTYSHQELTGLSRAAQTEEMVSARDWLVGHRLTRGADIVVFPGGAYSDETIEVMKQNVFLAGRSLNCVLDIGAGYQSEDIEIYNLISDSEFKNVRAAVDKAIASGNTCIIILHKIEPVTSDDQMQTDEALFEEVIEYLHQNREDISVVTMTQLFY